MIPQAFITAWSRGVPWPTETQVEQDLILSRLIIVIADHDLLGTELVLRGGTCLHMAALREVATTVGLTDHSYEQNWRMARVVFDAEPTSGVADASASRSRPTSAKSTTSMSG